MRRGDELKVKRPLRVLIAPDKFKGTLSACAVAQAIGEGLATVNSAYEPDFLPLSDGGDGFVECMVQAVGGRLRWEETVDPLGEKCRAAWGDLGKNLGGERVAVVGLTEASSLAKLALKKRNPLLTTNFGTGLILAKILKKNFDKIIIGIGGSATTEGGVGLLAPLGFQFLDRNNNSISFNGEGLSQLDRIIIPSVRWQTKFVVASDVENPLYGLKGAAHVFGPQKGGTPRMVEMLDRNLRNLAKITEKTIGFSPHNKCGAGAAGGCGYGLMAFLDADLISGFNILSELWKLPEKIKQFDLIVTGEGCLDVSTLHGKAPIRIAKLARESCKPIWAFCGQLKCDSKKLPFDKLSAVVKAGVNRREAMKNPVLHLKNTVIAAARRWKF